MNTKRKVKPAMPQKEYLYAIDIDVEHRGRITGHRVVAGQVLTVKKAPGRASGNYVFRYAERVGDELLLYVEQYGKRKTVRESDVTKVVGSQG